MSFRPVPRPARGPLVFAACLSAGCSLLINVDDCPSDDACGPGRACHAGRCVDLNPVDAAPDAVRDAIPDAGGAGGEPVDALPDGAATCHEAPVLGFFARYDLPGGARASRIEGSLDYADRAAFLLGFTPAGPFDAHWSARFLLDNPVTLAFALDTSGTGTVQIDGTERIGAHGDSTATISLGRGEHSLSVDALGLGADARAILTSARAGGSPRPVGGADIHTDFECDGLASVCDGVDDATLFEFEQNVFQCGGCGHVCSNPHGATACETGACKPTCDEGFVDTDGDPTNGCDGRLLVGDVCGVVDRTGDGTVVIGDVSVCPFDGDEATGTFELLADDIVVEGTLDGSGRGYGGGGGGGGGGGSECATPACPGAPPLIVGGRGGRPGSGGALGAAGELGAGQGCDNPATARGAGVRGGAGGGALGGAGGSGGPVRVGTDSPGVAHPGEAGGYDAPGTNTDASRTLDVLRGSGGGGGGGAGGLAYELCCGPMGGGGGAAGSSGGARVLLRATDHLRVADSGRILTRGGEPAGGNGIAGADTGGNGGDATEAGSGLGGTSATPTAECAPDAAYRIGTTGARGGQGAGGGILLQAPTIEIAGEVDARGGGGGRVNGGTVKLATCGPPPAARNVRAALVVDDLVAPNCMSARPSRP